MDNIISYALVLLASFITLFAQGFISMCYSKYKKVKNAESIAGKDIARYILDKHNLSKVVVEEVNGELTDHYDPSSKKVRLSKDIYEGVSIASLAVAAHECGHAIQDSEDYKFMRIRASLVPLVNLSSYAGYFAITVGLLLGFLKIIWLGIILEMVILLFQIVTLPVEIDASRRALQELDNYHLITAKEVKGSRLMLVAAASTYVASVANVLLQILRLILLYGRKRKD